MERVALSRRRADMCRVDARGRSALARLGLTCNCQTRAGVRIGNVGAICNRPPLHRAALVHASPESAFASQVRSGPAPPVPLAAAGTRKDSPGPETHIPGWRAPEAVLRHSGRLHIAPTSQARDCIAPLLQKRGSHPVNRHPWTRMRHRSRMGRRGRGTRWVEPGYRVAAARRKRRVRGDREPWLSGPGGGSDWASRRAEMCATW